MLRLVSLSGIQLWFPSHPIISCTNPSTFSEPDVVPIVVRTFVTIRQLALHPLRVPSGESMGTTILGSGRVEVCHKS